MTRHRRRLGLLLCVAGTALLTAACGTTTRPARRAVDPGPVRMLMGSAPQSLDPGADYTSEGAEINWLAYTGLTTYAHAAGVAGTRLIPGLATSLPAISDAGRTYTVTLRKGLVFSDGRPVTAGDFAYTVQRAIKIPWGGTGEFITPVIAGAAAYAAGRATTISGITTDDASGRIVIHLTAPYGPFDNVLALPALGIVPAGTPFRAQPTDPPAGVGPYQVTHIVPNQSFDVVRNPRWATMAIPGIPAGHENIDVQIAPDLQANALAVLRNSADLFDWSDTVPGGLLSQIRAQARSRFRLVDLGGATDYIFLNVAEKPFSSHAAREAVVTGLNLDAMSRLGAGTLTPACFLLPPDVPGHPTDASCPFGAPGTGDLTRARVLVRTSGMAGQPVTVWTQTRQPVQQWMTYYASFLNAIGFKATLRVIADATYFTTIGEEKTVHPQTGFASWTEDFPNPVDFYGVLLDGHAILPTNNGNLSEVNDPEINAAVTKLGSTPTTGLNRLASQWSSLDEYVAQKAYIAVFGYVRYPEFASNRIDYPAAVFQPLYGWDLSSLKLK